MKGMWTWEFTEGCITCNRQVMEAICNSRFYPNLLFMLSAFIVLAVLVSILSILATRRYRSRPGAVDAAIRLASIPLTTASTVLGIGIGGFVDGIVFHQVLQWHEMLTNKLPATDFIGKSVNMFWDGIFHAFTLLVTVVGIILLWNLSLKSNVNRSGYLLLGGLLLGWGLFNLVEGLIDHHLLALHNVRELVSHPWIWNYGFLLSGLILLILGGLGVRRGVREARVI